MFCNKHGLSPSVKAGGYGTGGWAINGDIVIDLSKIQDVDIEPPQQGGDGYTSLRDTALSTSKGKSRVGGPVSDPSGPAARKQHVEGDTEQAATHAPNDTPLAWLYSAASTTVASFLHGSALLPDEFGEEPRRPAVGRPRLGIDSNVLTVSTSPPPRPAESPTPSTSPALGSRTGSGSGGESSVPSLPSVTGWSTHATTPAPSRLLYSDPSLSAATPASSSPFAWAEPFETAPSRPDPFAYIDNAEPPMFGASLSSPPTSNVPVWGAGTSLFGHPLFAGDVPPHLTRPVAPHTHAYISFGAGASQKDVDLFTASHPLDDGGVPYHVPLCVHLL